MYGLLNASLRGASMLDIFRFFPAKLQMSSLVVIVRKNWAIRFLFEIHFNECFSQCIRLGSSRFAPVRLAERIIYGEIDLCVAVTETMATSTTNENDIDTPIYQLINRIDELVSSGSWSAAYNHECCSHVVSAWNASFFKYSALGDIRLCGDGQSISRMRSVWTI